MSLRLAIVGCGAVAQQLYRRPLQQLERRRIISVAAIVDPIADHSAKLGVFFPHATREDCVDAALTKSKIDLTLILSPAHLHCEQVIAAMQFGSHVHCEKPMAATVLECVRMNNMARQTGLILGVGMIRRFFPAFAELKRIVDDGVLGQLRAFEYREGRKFEWDVTTPAGFRPRREGGTGVLFDIGPHAIDSLLWILGDLRVRSYADDALAGIESNVHMELDAAVALGSVDLSWDFPQTNELRIVGDQAEAVLRIDRFDQLAVGRAERFVPVAIRASFPADVSEGSVRRMMPQSYESAIFCQLIQTIRAVLLREAPAADGHFSQTCVAILETALTKAEPLSMPWLSIVEQQAFWRMHWRALS